MAAHVHPPVVPWILGAALLGAGLATGAACSDGRAAESATAGPAAGLAAGLAAPLAVPLADGLTGEERHTIEVFERSSPSVVHINTFELVQISPFSPKTTLRPRGSGSGFVWDDQGHIVTNYHVIEGADDARVTLNDQSTFDAKLVGYYLDKDLAVLQIEAPREKLRPITVGQSHDLRVGQKVLAIGNPFGLDQTLTTGVVSALGREMESLTGRKIEGVIQTDAAINRGNSGGPLLDSWGRLIGVNTQIYSNTGSYVGIGFAIPVEEVLRVVPDIVTYGEVQRPVLGIGTMDLINRATREGKVLVTRVVAGSGAARAGLRAAPEDRFGTPLIRNSDGFAGDIIEAVDGRPIASRNDLLDVLFGYEIGDTVTLTLLRDEQRLKVPVQLSRP